MSCERQMSDAQIKKLVVDVHGGSVFCDWMIPEEERERAMMYVFVVLVMMDKEQRDQFLSQEPAMIYEYLEEAGPRTVNGLPTFFSLSYLNKADYTAFRQEFTKYLELQREFAGETK